MVTVPEASMNADNRSVAREHDVRTPGQVASMQSKPYSQTMQGLANQQFRLGVFPANARHERATFVT